MMYNIRKAPRIPDGRICIVKKFLWFCCLFVLLCVFVYSGYQLIRYWSENTQSTSAYQDLTHYIEIPEASDTPESAAPSEAEDATPDIRWPQVDFAALKQINPDIVGWLYCEGTEINYPVVQGEDNSYYLNHLFDGTGNPSGCLFLDCSIAGDFSAPHSIIYGHNMKNGLMFAQLEQYKEQAYYEAHPQMLLLTPEQNYTITLFSGYTASSSADAWTLHFADQTAWSDWLQRAVDQSVFQSAYQPSDTDTIITLSTCSYDFDEARFVLLGALQAAE